MLGLSLNNKPSQLCKSACVYVKSWSLCRFPSQLGTGSWLVNRASFRVLCSNVVWAWLRIKPSDGSLFVQSFYQTILVFIDIWLSIPYCLGCLLIHSCAKPFLSCNQVVASSCANSQVAFIARMAVNLTLISHGSVMQKSNQSLWKYPT